MKLSLVVQNPTSAMTLVSISIRSKSKPGHIVGYVYPVFPSWLIEHSVVVVITNYEEILN
jgi:hypothetical protein